MTRMRSVLLWAVTASSVLTACAMTPNQGVQFVPVALAPKIEPAPYWAMRPCPRLLALPPEDHSQEESENAWTLDEKLYDDCRKRHAHLVAYIRSRDAGLTGTSLTGGPVSGQAKPKASAKPVPKPKKVAPPAKKTKVKVVPKKTVEPKPAAPSAPAPRPEPKTDIAAPTPETKAE